MALSFCMLKIAGGRDEVAINPAAVTAVRPGQPGTSRIDYHGGEIEVAGSLQEIVLKLIVTSNVEPSIGAKSPADLKSAW